MGTILASRITIGFGFAYADGRRVMMRFADVFVRDVYNAQNVLVNDVTGSYT